MEKKYILPINGIGWTNAPAHIMRDGLTYSVTVYVGTQMHNRPFARHFSKTFVQELPEVFRDALKLLFQEFIKGTDAEDLSLSQHGSRKFASKEEIDSIKEALNDIWGA